MIVKTELHFKMFWFYFRNRLNVGLFKLSEANSLVGEMSVELESLGPKIEEKQRVHIIIVS